MSSRAVWSRWAARLATFFLLPVGAQAQPVVSPPVLESSAPVPYPSAALAAGVEGEVLLRVTVELDGSVSAAEPLSQSGFGFEDAVLAAILRSRFRPARVDGVLQRAQLLFRYRFTLSPPGAASPWAAPLDAGALSSSTPYPLAAPVLLRGQLWERGARAPIAGARLVLTAPGATAVEASSDAAGRFSLLVPAAGAGEGRLSVEAPGYQPLAAPLALEPGQELALTLRLVPTVADEYGLTVRGEEPEVEVTRSLRPEELASLPGTQGDPLRALQSLPGVARVPLGAGTTAVRGSSPEDTLVLLNGMPIPILFHTAGISSVLAGPILSGVEYNPGAYSVQYGRGTGGLIQARTRLARPARASGALDLDVFDAGAFFSAPLGEEGAVAVSARRSYIDAVLPVFAPDTSAQYTIAPRFWDYQLLGTRRLAGGEAQLLLFGALDSLALSLTEPGSGEQFERSLTRFHRAQALWEDQLAPGLWRRVGASIGQTVVENAQSPDTDLGVVTYLGAARVDWASSLGARAALRYGLDLRSDHFTRRGRAPGENNTSRESEFQGETNDLGAYVEGDLLLASWLRVVPGLRVDRLGGTHQLVADPRLSARAVVSEKMALRGGAGVFHKDPQPFELDPSFGDPGLNPERALQSTLGLERRLWRDQLWLDASAYWKRMDGLVVTTGSGATQAEVLSNQGEGRAYGLEVVLRRPPGGRLFGWLSYGLSRAERRAAPGGPWVPFSFDQPHALAAVGSYQLDRGWSVGGRFRYTSGSPVAAIDAVLFDADSGLYRPIRSEVEVERLPPFHQLDVRVDKSFLFASWKVSAYLEILNVYNRQNPESLSFNFDFTQQRFFPGLPILPTLGLKGEF